MVKKRKKNKLFVIITLHRQIIYWGDHMKMTNRQYGEYVKKMSPNSPLAMDLVRAFLVGGLICCIGQALSNGYIQIGLNEDNASTLTSVTLIFIGALLTGLKLYDKIAKFAGAGTLVPITGFSNAVVSPAIEFKTEGLVTGLAAKMFVLAGPVIVYGISASVVYGFIYWIITVM